GPQDFQDSQDAFDREAADGFVVPSGAVLGGEEVGLQGGHPQRPGPGGSVKVRFHQDAGYLPGTLVAERANLTYTGGPSFAIRLDPGVSLPEGRSWVSVVANQDWNPFGDWGWVDRGLTSNQPAAWRNPGGGWNLCRG